MISYETYKAFHLFFILCFFSSIGFISYDSDLVKKKIGKVMVGIASFLILVAGMGLIARLGYKHGEPFPLWIKLKMVNWVFANIFLVLAFKIKPREQKAIFTTLLLICVWCVIWLAIKKPL